MTAIIVERKLLINAIADSTLGGQYYLAAVDDTAQIVFASIYRSWNPWPDKAVVWQIPQFSPAGSDRLANEALWFVCELRRCGSRRVRLLAGLEYRDPILYAEKHYAEPWKEHLTSIYVRLAELFITKQNQGLQPLSPAGSNQTFSSQQSFHFILSPDQVVFLRQDSNERLYVGSDELGWWDVTRYLIQGRFAADANLALNGGDNRWSYSQTTPANETVASWSIARGVRVEYLKQGTPRACQEGRIYLGIEDEEELPPTVFGKKVTISVEFEKLLFAVGNPNLKQPMQLVVFDERHSDILPYRPPDNGEEHVDWWPIPLFLPPDLDRQSAKARSLVCALLGITEAEVLAGEKKVVDANAIAYAEVYYPDQWRDRLANRHQWLVRQFVAWLNGLSVDDESYFDPEGPKNDRFVFELDMGPKVYLVQSISGLFVGNQFGDWYDTSQVGCHQFAEAAEIVFNRKVPWWRHYEPYNSTKPEGIVVATWDPYDKVVIMYDANGVPLADEYGRKYLGIVEGQFGCRIDPFSRRPPY